MTTINYISTNPAQDAQAKAKTLHEGYDIREYEDGIVGLYSNSFLPFIFYPEGHPYIEEHMGQFTPN